MVRANEVFNEIMVLPPEKRNALIASPVPLLWLGEAKIKKGETR